MELNFNYDMVNNATNVLKERGLKAETRECIPNTEYFQVVVFISDSTEPTETISKAFQNEFGVSVFVVDETEFDLLEIY